MRDAHLTVNRVSELNAKIAATNARIDELEKRLEHRDLAIASAASTAAVDATLRTFARLQANDKKGRL